MAAIVEVAYNTGIRKGELKKMDSDQVDFAGDVLILYRGETKGGKPRTVPLLGNMREVLLRDKEDREKHWPQCKLFHRLGEPIKDFRGSWEAACVRAGVTDLKFHDLRRSGARNLSRAGVPETVIMKITGHQTRSMLDRYNITSDVDLADAAVKLKAYRASKISTTGIGTATNSATAPENEKGSGSLQSP